MATQMRHAAEKRNEIKPGLKIPNLRVPGSNPGGVANFFNALSIRANRTRWQ
jgi:hypothetical protein